MTVRDVYKRQGLWFSWMKNPSAKHFFIRRYLRIYPTWLIKMCIRDSRNTQLHDLDDGLLIVYMLAHQVEDGEVVLLLKVLQTVIIILQQMCIRDSADGHQSYGPSPMAAIEQQSIDDVKLQIGRAHV